VDEAVQRLSRLSSVSRVELASSSSPTSPVVLCVSDIMLTLVLDCLDLTMPSALLFVLARSRTDPHIPSYRLTPCGVSFHSLSSSSSRSRFSLSSPQPVSLPHPRHMLNKQDGSSSSHGLTLTPSPRVTGKRGREEEEWADAEVEMLQNVSLGTRTMLTLPGSQPPIERRPFCSGFNAPASCSGRLDVGRCGSVRGVDELQVPI
jgi:hypothetical protein